MLNRFKKTSKKEQLSSSDASESRPYAAAVNGGPTLPDLDQLLAADLATRKKFVSQFRWFHDRQKISSRQAAETKLKLFCAAKAGAGNAGNKKKNVKEEVIFLVRSSTICEDDFILSILAAQKCYHYKIQLTVYSEYLLVSVETPAHEQVRFHGLNELIDTLCKPNRYLTYVPVITMPCTGGEAPPSLAISHGYNNSLHESINSNNSELAMKIIGHAQHPPLNDRDSKGNTAIHLAVKRNMLEVVRALLKLGASVAPLNEQRFSALHLSCRGGRGRANKLIIHELLERGKMCNNTYLVGEGPVNSLFMSCLRKVGCAPIHIL